MIRKLSKEDFLTTYGPLHESIFKNSSQPDFPFVSKDWEVALLPYGELEFADVDFFALMQSSLEMADNELIITVFETSPPHQDNVVISWDKETLTQVRNSFFGNFCCHLFGRSGTWGVASYWDDSFWVGGSNKFMELFTRKAGGRFSLKERFLDFARTQWRLPKDLQKVVLSTVGWRNKAEIKRD